MSKWSSSPSLPKTVCLQENRTRNVLRVLQQLHKDALTLLEPQWEPSLKKQRWERRRGINKRTKSSQFKYSNKILCLLLQKDFSLCLCWTPRKPLEPKWCLRELTAHRCDTQWPPALIESMQSFYFIYLFFGQWYDLLTINSLLSSCQHEDATRRQRCNGRARHWAGHDL